jgi:hypothetical protein
VWNIFGKFSQCLRLQLLLELLRKAFAAKRSKLCCRRHQKRNSSAVPTWLSTSKSFTTDHSDLFEQSADLQWTKRWETLNDSHYVESQSYFLESASYVTTIKPDYTLTTNLLPQQILTTTTQYKPTTHTNPTQYITPNQRIIQTLYQTPYPKPQTPAPIPITTRQTDFQCGVRVFQPKSTSLVRKGVEVKQGQFPWWDKFLDLWTKNELWVLGWQRIFITICVKTRWFAVEGEIQVTTSWIGELSHPNFQPHQH